MPQLNQETEEGHVTNEINHLKSNSKPQTPLDMSMKLRRDSVDLNLLGINQKRSSHLSQYQDQAVIAASK